MQVVPDLVRLSKLDTQFLTSEHTQHVHFISGGTSTRKKIRKEERWKREKLLGCGSFGKVSLEQCIHGDSEGKLRAVKKIQKLNSNNYYRELEAIALFSQSRYEQCFVKSSGWYENEENIFIAMEYFPNGDLQNYLSSPLPELEGQHIVLQVLEGLVFMHHYDFTHRDLKPANILVVYRGPKWWVKIADFGITKRATEGHTALRTLTGTTAFMAPEVLGFITSGSITSGSYTNAVDIWSLSVITFLILTGELLFSDQRRLGQYVQGIFKFPSDTLLANKISIQGCEFIRSLMAPMSEDRPGAEQSLKNPWLADVIEPAAFETQRVINAPTLQETSSFSSIPEPSASWSTQGASLAYMPQRPADTFFQPADHKLYGSLKPNNQSSSFELPTRHRVPAPPPTNSEDKTGEKTIRPVQEAVPILTEAEKEAESWKTVGNAFMKKQDYSLAILCYTKALAITPNAAVYLSNRAAAHQHSKDYVGACTDAKAAIAADPKYSKAWSRLGHAKLSLGDVQGSINAYEMCIALESDGGSESSKKGLEAAKKQLRYLEQNKGASSLNVKSQGAQRFNSFDRESLFSPTLEKTESTSEARSPRYLKRPMTLKGHSKRVNAVAFSPDGKLIASASNDNTVRLWKSDTGATHARLKGHLSSVVFVKFSADGKLVVSASDDYIIRLWKSSTGAAVAKCIGYSNWVTAVATLSLSSKLIASASLDNTVTIWNSANKAGTKIQSDDGLIIAVALSPDDKLIATASRKDAVRVWDLAAAEPENTVSVWDSVTGKLHTRLTGHQSWIVAVAFSPDGKLIATASVDNTVKVWDTALGILRMTFRGHISWVVAVVFSPDGKLIASASMDDTVRVWESDTGAVYATLKGHSDSVFALAFSPDSMRIASVSADTTVKLWELS